MKSVAFYVFALVRLVGDIFSLYRVGVILIEAKAS